METLTLPSPAEDLLRRVRMEFTEMPGLALTREQARRLWNMNRPVCDGLLAALVAEAFLSVSRDGAFRRPSCL